MSIPKAAPLGIQERVDRLLEGDIRPQDLAEIFLHLRQRCAGRKVVREVGDFVAHREERDRGLSTHLSSYAFVVYRYHVAHVKERYTYGRLPPNIGLVLQCNLARLGDDFLLAHTGIDAKRRNAVLKKIVCKFAKNPDGTISMPPLAGDQLALWKALTGSFVAGVSFTLDDLVAEFVELLDENKLLKGCRGDATSFLKAPLGVFSISALHGSRLKLDDGSVVDVRALVDGDGILLIGASAECPIPGGGMARISESIFSTGLEAARHCDPVSLPVRDRRNIVFLCPIEMGPDGLIHRLGTAEPWCEDTVPFEGRPWTAA